MKTILKLIITSPLFFIAIGLLYQFGKKGELGCAICFPLAIFLWLLMLSESDAIKWAAGLYLASSIVLFLRALFCCASYWLDLDFFKTWFDPKEPRITLLLFGTALIFITGFIHWLAQKFINDTEE